MHAGFDKTSRINAGQSDITPLESKKTSETSIDVKTPNSRLHSVMLIEFPSEGTKAVNHASIPALQGIQPTPEIGNFIMHVSKDFAPAFQLTVDQFSKYVKADAAEMQRILEVERDLKHRKKEEEVQILWNTVKNNFKELLVDIERHSTESKSKPNPD